MTSLTDLASEIETGPASRELSDRVLMACGCVPEHHHLPRHTKWRMPSGARFVTPPDPLKDLNAIASIERESGAIWVRVDTWSAPGLKWTSASVLLPAPAIDAGRVSACALVHSSPHAEPRARCAALCRALAARTRTGQP